MIRTTDALESDCKGKLVHHHSAKRLSQVATAGAHRRQVVVSYLLHAIRLKRSVRLYGKFQIFGGLGFGEICFKKRNRKKSEPANPRRITKNRSKAFRRSCC